ncbi:hypothetical protein ACFOPX_01765 [Helicobacter baculiformis]|uniref:Uncharacterized protein n=1 Tax=Helicobacter baculiformis TaxID=427351 RepID=A0ABV7ZII9_9HELI|nr:hypothetical protein [Helicobacter baculiformis]
MFVHLNFELHGSQSEERFYLGNVGIHLLSVPFVGSFGFVGLFCMLHMVLNSLLRLKPFRAQESLKVPLTILFKVPSFLLATCICALGFGLMTLVMHATPLAMHAYHFSYTQSQSILSAHFVAICAPSLLLAFLKQVLSPLRLVVLGLCYYVWASAIALYSVGFNPIKSDLLNIRAFFVKHSKPISKGNFNGTIYFSNFIAFAPVC